MASDSATESIDLTISEALPMLAAPDDAFRFTDFTAAVGESADGGAGHGATFGFSSTAVRQQSKRAIF